MKKLILLIILFFALPKLCYSFDFEANKWTDFEGTLGKINIQLSLYRFENGKLKGNYCYRKYESKIELTGQIIGDKIILTELMNGKPSGNFEGKFFTDNFDRFDGTWSDDSKTSEFKLKLSSICGSDYKHRYSDFYGTDKDVEAFMKNVKNSILNNDKNWIGNHIKYPIKTTTKNLKIVIIKNKKQLIENFEQIFHQDFKDKVKSTCICNMFNNSQGVMLGNGEIWIYNAPNSNENKFDFNITSINN